MRLTEALTKICSYKDGDKSEGFKSVGIYAKNGEPIIPFVEKEATSQTYVKLIEEDPEVAYVTTYLFMMAQQQIFMEINTITNMFV